VRTERTSPHTKLLQTLRLTCFGSACLRCAALQAKKAELEAAFKKLPGDLAKLRKQAKGKQPLSGEDSKRLKDLEDAQKEIGVNQTRIGLLKRRVAVAAQDAAEA
jgi:hypothetical protein